MSAARRLRLIVAALFVASGCGAREPLSIGDATPRDTSASVLDVVQEAFDSASPPIPVRIERWTTGIEEELNSSTIQAERFAALPGLVGVVGPAGSRIALVAAAVFNERGVPQVVPNATSRRLATAGRWTFMLAPHDGIEGEALASYALDSLRLERITVLYLGDEYGTGIRDGVIAALRVRGRELTDQVLVPSAQPCALDDPTSLTSVITRASLRRAPPEVVILAVSTPVAACLIQIIAAERPGLWLLGADGVELSRPGFHDLPADLRARIRAVAFALPSGDSATVRFLERARRILGREPFPSEALIYDAFMVLAAAAVETGGNREDVRDWIDGLGGARPSWPGASGPIGFRGPRRDLIRFVAIPGSTP